ncbi:DUF1775 domain-containing protein [Streptomyces sp. NBC_00996]|uniref:DUF1775 domain-containing protein n=1 Tax=Streptomyces sp. NBC_00996 TaxID=2903710 RepID=UPI00386D9E68|nr:YcnI family protein [Streptomyces sp. NBC_00996]
MFPHHPVRAAHRIVAVGALVLTATFAPADPASAHAEADADRPQALAENVTLTFTSEAESAAAGFTQMRVVLPDGIAPGDVTLGDAPRGWKFKRTGDGYSVGGPALATGVDAEHTVKVRQLPDAEQVVFKTVDTYGDGRISRWIELPTGGEEPEQPAPVLELKQAAPGASPAGSASAPTGTTEGTAHRSVDAARAEDAAEAGDTAPPAGLVVGAAVAALLVLAGGAWLVRRRTARGGHR